MNTKVIGYATLAAFITAGYINPMYTAMFAIIAFIAIPMLEQAFQFADMVSQVPHATMQEYYDAFSVEPEELTAEDALDEQLVDIWEQPTTACELACTITSQYNYDYQLCLPAGNDIDISIEELTEQVQIISYESYSYRELQQLVKAIRGNDKSIKLTAKKAKLIEYLKANA